MIDDRTPNLNLAKPSVGNTLLEDVTRLRSAFDTLDTVVSGKQEALGYTPLNATQKGANGGVCELTAEGFVPAVRLPSYVDDVVEFVNFAALPATGEVGKIYVLQTAYTVGGITSNQFRWSGSSYAPISASPGTTDAVTEGSVNLYHTAARARAAQLPATAVTPGLVKIGSGLTVTADGLIAVDASTSFTESLIPITSNGQTAFVVDGGYTAASVQVLLNGVELLRNDDFFATDGVNLTLAQGVNTADKLLVRSWKAFLNTGPVSFPAAPVNTAPANGITIPDATATFSGGSFLAPDGATHVATQVQFSTSAGFGTIALDTGALAAATSVSINLSTLTLNTTYFWRMRYQGSGGQWSVWSTPTSFAMPALLPSYILTPEATPAIGDPFEGGFYAGMIWQQVTQSSSSVVTGTGSKTFTVPDQSVTPMFYEGQMVEVRRRAEPGTKMAGTVALAAGTTLVVNVTSALGASGTFTDWSVMARFRIIVAPKAGGETSNKAIGNSTLALPAACQTLTEGMAATQAMRDAGTSTVYPAAHWARNLTINGRTDWYIPARDELEICFRNLKPTTNDNNTSNIRSQSVINYTNNGSYGGADTRTGLNDNSEPTGSAYTSINPGQTTVNVFKSGNSEVFTSDQYISSSEFSTSDNWTQFFVTASLGLQVPATKTTSSLRIRAVRRSII